MEYSKEKMKEILAVKERQYNENNRFPGITASIIRQTCLLLGIGGEDVFESLDKQWCMTLSHFDFQKESFMWIDRASKLLKEHRDEVFNQTSYYGISYEQKLEARVRMLETEMRWMIEKVYGGK